MSIIFPIHWAPEPFPKKGCDSPNIVYHPGCFRNLVSLPHYISYTIIFVFLQVFLFFGFWMCTYIVAFFVSMAFEAPMIGFFIALLTQKRVYLFSLIMILKCIIQYHIISIWYTLSVFSQATMKIYLCTKLLLFCDNGSFCSRYVYKFSILLERWN